MMSYLAVAAVAFMALLAWLFVWAGRNRPAAPGELPERELGT